MSVPISALESILSRRARSTFRIFPLERQDRLEPPIAPLLGGAAGAVPLDDVELGFARIARLAVGELAGERRVVELPLAHDLARLARGLARLGGDDGLLDDLPRGLRVLLEELPELVVDVVSTMVFTSLETSLLLVCESKLGSGCLMLMTAVSPSRMSSP
jgi:hypothetical protein